MAKLKHCPKITFSAITILELWDGKVGYSIQFYDGIAWAVVELDTVAIFDEAYLENGDSWERDFWTVL